MIRPLFRCFMLAVICLAGLMSVNVSAQGSGIYNPPARGDLIRAGAVLSDGGIVTNLSALGMLTVSGVISNRPAVIAGPDTGTFAGYYYYAGTNELHGNYFTNASGCLLSMDVEYLYGGNWILESYEGVAFVFDGESWYTPDFTPAAVLMPQPPFHGSVSGSLDAERGVSAGGVNIGSTGYLAGFGVPAVTASGMVIAGDGSATRPLTGGVIFDVNQKMIVFGQNTASFTTNINPDYIGYYARVSSYPGYEGLSVVRAGATVSEDIYVFNVTPDEVKSTLPANFPGYLADGLEGITTNCTFEGTNKLNIVGGIIVGINN